MAFGFFEHRISGFWKGKTRKKPQFLETHVEGFCGFFRSGKMEHSPKSKELILGLQKLLVDVTDL